MNATSAKTSTEPKVAQVMSTDLMTLKVDDTLRLADDMLNLTDVRHFPVLDGELIAGIVDHDDLLHASMASLVRDRNHTPREALGAVAVKDIMKPAVTIGPDTPVRSAAETMVERGIEALLIVDGKKLLGMVTRTDLLRELAKRIS